MRGGNQEQALVQADERGERPVQEGLVPPHAREEAHFQKAAGVAEKDRVTVEDGGPEQDGGAGENGGERREAAGDRAVYRWLRQRFTS